MNPPGFLRRRKVQDTDLCVRAAPGAFVREEAGALEGGHFEEGHGRRVVVRRRRGRRPCGQQRVGCIVSGVVLCDAEVLREVVVEV